MPATLGGLSKVVSVTAGPVVPLFNLDVARNRTFFVGRHEPFDAGASLAVSARTEA